MSARTPEELDTLFEQELNAGNIEGLVGLYEPNATFTAEPGKNVTGTAAIREALSGFLQLKPQMSLQARVLANTGDIALTSSKWELTGAHPDGTPLELKGESAEVSRRQADGTWKFVVDNPWGLA
jgi:uncharacterized protein (TIGR02246 family)